MVSAEWHKEMQLEHKIAKLEQELAMCRRYNEQHGQNLAAIAEENQRLRDCMERAHDEVMDDPREAIRLLNEGLEGYEPR